MKRLLFAFVLVLLIESSAFATWSVVAIDKKTGQAIIASATCVAQAGFPLRRPMPAYALRRLEKGRLEANQLCTVVLDHLLRA